MQLASIKRAKKFFTNFREKMLRRDNREKNFRQISQPSQPLKMIRKCVKKFATSDGQSILVKTTVSNDLKRWIRIRVSIFQGGSPMSHTKDLVYNMTQMPLVSHAATKDTLQTRKDWYKRLTFVKTRIVNQSFSRNIK